VNHLSAFFEQSLPMQLKTLFLEGEFVVAIRYYGYKVNLYLLEGVYIEVFYHHLEDRIEKIIPLDAGCSRMKFYTDQIQIKEEGLRRL
jgi:hypothetical protein